MNILANRKMECLRCPEGNSFFMGSILWIDCKLQEGLREIGDVCNLEKRTLSGQKI